MDLSKLTQGERIVLIAGVLLIIDLLLLPWHKLTGPQAQVVRSLGEETSLTAIQRPNAVYGVLALLVTLVLVGLIVAKLANAKLPDLPVPLPQVLLVGGIIVLALLFLKLIVEANFLGFGAYLGVLLGAAVAFGGFTIKKEATGAGGLGGLRP